MATREADLAYARTAWQAWMDEARPKRHPGARASALERAASRRLMLIALKDPVLYDIIIIGRLGARLH